MRGQASVEFILVLVIALAYILVVTQPNADLSSSSIEDVSNLAKLRVSADKLTNTIQYVSLSGAGTRQTIQLVVPNDSNISCEPSSGPSTTLRIQYALKSKEGSPGCYNDNDAVLNPNFCNKTISVDANFSCSAGGQNPTVMRPGIYRATVEKNSAGVVANLIVVG